MTKEMMIFARGKWEFATKEHNSITGNDQWIRRNSSWICNCGDELAVMPVPPKPAKKESAK
jgi:hypothetical protein